MILLCGIALLTACAKKQETLPLSSDSVMHPYQEFGKTTLYFYEGKYKRWKLEAEYMKKPLFDTGAMLVTPVLLLLYDSLGNLQTRVVSDSGSTTPSLKKPTGHLW